MFGEYEHTVDAKGRMFLPAKFRNELGDRVFLTIDTDRCLCIYPVAVWENYVERIEQLPQIKSKGAKRFLFSSASEIEVDGQGRVLIPANLRAYAGLEKNVTVIGVGKNAEIWDTEAFKKFKDETDPKALEEELSELGF